MILKKIELYGFKSFADRQVINFEGGITGIIGPNGCGKSNVADAIRWVQGEQSSKLLRGSHMQDVIFNGTEKRKSLSYCEVSIFFDNTTRMFPIDYNEVVISRKLFRSGESEYAINREECRLKDIVNLLHDAHIGKEGYSIIGQGQVEKILSSKPEDRRAIFEEAIGIAKHKSIKQESERKLERTEDNLTRIHDIKTEIERQFNPLKKQAENAKIYLDLKEKLKNFEVNSYLYQFEKANEIKSKINARIAEIAEELDLKQKQSDEINKNYALCMQDIIEIDLNLKKHNEEVLNLTIAIEKSQGESKLFEERLNFLKQQKEKFEEEAQNLTDELKIASANLNNNKNSIAEKQKELDSLNSQQKIVQETYLKIVDELATGEDEVENSQKKMLESLNSLSEINIEVARLNALKAGLEADIKDGIQKRGELTAKLATLNAEKLASNENLNKLKANVNYLQSRFDASTTELTKAEAIYKQTENETYANKSKLNSIQNKHKILVNLEQDSEGYAFSVKKLLQESKINPRLKGLLLGTVAEKFKTEERFEVAMEMALAASLSNVIVDNEDKAKEIIAYLKQNNFGRATMLPLTSVKPRSIDPKYNALVKQNAIGIASNLIKFEPQFKNVFECLLGATVVCDNIDSAIKLAKLTGYAFKIVTLNGEILNNTGSISGGSRKNEGTSIISRAREISELEVEIKNVYALVDKNEKFLNSQNDLIGDLKKQQSDFLNKLGVSKTELAKFEEAYKAIENKAADLSAELATIKDENEQKAVEIKGIENKVKFLENNKNVAADAKTEANSSIEKRQKQFENLKRQRDTYNENITSIKVKIGSTESEISALVSDCERLESEIEAITQKRDSAADNAKKVERGIYASSQVKFAGTDQEVLKENRDRLEKIKQKLASFDNYKLDKQTELANLESSRASIGAEIERVKEKKFNEELNLTKVDTDMDFLQDKVNNEYELTYEDALKYKEENYDFENGEKEIVKIKRDISRLGSVNVNAIEDVREMETRLNEYQTQEEDLLKAKADLTKAIKELSAEMISKFDSEFKIIQENFSKIFKELFGGGNAKLIEIKNEEDPLQNGIEIVAEPPGKKLQSITLLSGGEKALTAIAILFAILRLRPMPFCLLDEIEAALDEANVTRFATYLKRFSEVTQFIVITHRKPTMELADSLYGVTMEEKGVSKLVSVKLTDIK